VLWFESMEVSTLCAGKSSGHSEIIPNGLFFGRPDFDSPSIFVSHWTSYIEQVTNLL